MSLDSPFAEFLAEPFPLVDPFPGSPDLPGNGDLGNGTSQGVNLLSSPSNTDGPGGVYPDPLLGSNDGSSLDDSDPILKYINQLLMEEDKEDNPWFFGDEAALRSTEKSLYDALGENYPLKLPCLDAQASVGCLDVGMSPSGTLPLKDSHLGSCGGVDTSISSSSSDDPSSVSSVGEFVDHALVDASNFGRETIQLDVANPPGNTKSGWEDLGHADLLVGDIFKDNDSVLQFKKGLEEASKFLPSSTLLLRDFDDSRSMPFSRKDFTGGLKHRARDDEWVDQGRASKQTAVAGDEGEISDMFDKVLLYDGQANAGECPLSTSMNSRLSDRRRISKDGKGFVKKQTRKSSVDLRSLLFLCAEAVNGHDLRTANALLKQIRDNSSASGDGSERLAHYFANGLEARIAGNEGDAGSFYTSSTFCKTSAVDMLKAYQAYISACPFMKFPIFFSGYMISKLAESAKVLHIIDFGIGFGFHWPIVIQRISQRSLGPPKLRITGIDYPVPGLRPARRIEEACRRLGRYCDRFGVPFEYNAVASHEWETIKMEELKIRRGETIAVNSHCRLKNLMDGVGEKGSPRDAVLELMRKIKPDLLVHSTQSGAYNSPFFLTRFREAMFHFSGVYEMLDMTMRGEPQEREIAEGEFYGREIRNVIGCEGVERPETYEQWHERKLRAGFRPVRLEGKIMEYLRRNMGRWYHKDFMMDEYKECWMLLGWRGRVTNVSSCWVPDA